MRSTVYSSQQGNMVSETGTHSKKESSQESSQEKTSNKILAAMKKNPGVKIAELAVLCGLTTRAIQKNIDSLRDKGLLSREGSTKAGLWRVNSNTGN